MVDYEKEFESRSYNGENAYETAAVRARTAVFPLVYGWMCAGLALSGVVAWWTAASGLWESIVLSKPVFLGLIVAELAMVWTLSAFIRKLPVAAAFVMFLAYSVLNGLTLSVLFIAYEIALIQRVFFITAGMFGGLALYGTTTRSDVSGVGAFCGMALWGVIIASVVNIFMRSSGLDWALSVVGVAVFSGLTMWDAQKIRLLANAEAGMDRDTALKASLMGALELYLDFVNLFIFLLKLFGRRR